MKIAYTKRPVFQEPQIWNEETNQWESYVKKRARQKIEPEYYDVLRELISRQDANNFSTEGILDFFLCLFRSKKWLNNGNVVTAEGINAYDKFLKKQ